MCAVDKRRRAGVILVKFYDSLPDLHSLFGVAVLHQAISPIEGRLDQFAIGRRPRIFTL